VFTGATERSFRTVIFVDGTGSQKRTRENRERLLARAFSKEPELTGSDKQKGLPRERSSTGNALMAEPTSGPCCAPVAR
jgi:hypothetical protein